MAQSAIAAHSHRADSVSLADSVRDGGWRDDDDDEMALCVEVDRDLGAAPGSRRGILEQAGSSAKPADAAFTLEAERPSEAELPLDFDLLDFALRGHAPARRPGLDHTLGIHGRDVERAGCAGHARYGAITVARRHLAGTLAITAGHVVLPAREGRITRRFAAGGDVVTASVQDGDGRHHPGSVLAGDIGGPLDWAMVFLPGVQLGQVSIHDLARDEPAPLRARSSHVAPGETVFQYSPVFARDRRIEGRVLRRAETEVRLRLADGSRARYTDVITVGHAAGGFSMPMDSGSCVYDERGLVVGIVVGGGWIREPDGIELHVSRVLRIRSLIDRLDADPLGAGFFEYA